MPNNDYQPTEPIWQNTVSVSTQAQLQSAVNAAGSTPTIIVLTNDIVLNGTSINIPASAVIKIECADERFSIDANQLSTVINVRGTLYLENVTVTGGRNSSYGGGINVFSGAELNLNNDALITNNHAGSGAGVYVSGELKMYGGSIDHNTTDYGSGGGIWVRGGSALGAFYMYGGNISYNTAANSGGGILADLQSTVTIHNGTISYNTAQSEGGGISSNGYVNMYGGVINGNKATNGGGIYMSTNSTWFNPVLNIEGGSITNNTATVVGGGVLQSRLNYLYVADGVIFSGNKAFLAYARNPIDDALYYSHIFATQWTVPFSQGYNNYDIGYVSETPVSKTASVNLSGTKHVI